MRSPLGQDSPRLAFCLSLTVQDGARPPAPTLPARPRAVGGGGRGRGACPWAAGVTRGARKRRGRRQSRLQSSWLRSFGSTMDGWRRFCVCVFLSGICLAMGHMIHSVNIYRALIHFPGKFSSQCQPGPMDSHSNIPKTTIPFFKVYCQFSAAWLLC